MTWVLLVVLLLCSATASGSETALFGLGRQDVQAFAASASRLRRAAARLAQKPRNLLLTVLITNTAVNVAFFAITTMQVKALGHVHPLLASCAGVGALLVVIVFGEILPKSLALAHARGLAPLVVPLIYTVELLLTPVRWLFVTLLVEPATRLLRPAHVPVDAVSTEDLRALVEASARQEVLTTTENEMLQAVVGLADVSVRAVMVPRVEILAVRLHDDPQAIRSRFAESGKTKLPVCGRDLDDVKGLLYARDYYLCPDLPLSRLLRRVDFVPEQADLIQVIRYFRQRHSQLAVVVDEYGGVAGLVSLEDVLEEIVGELPGRDHDDVPPAERLDENTYRLSGRLSVREWSELFDIPTSHKQVDTLSGLVVMRLGRLARVGDTVHTGNLTLTVESVRRRRIDRLILRREPASPHRENAP